MTPSYYTSHEGGQWIKWPSDKTITTLPDGILAEYGDHYKAVVDAVRELYDSTSPTYYIDYTRLDAVIEIEGIRVHSLAFGEIHKDDTRYWDVLNGWR
jgi:hypothetical protein